MSQTLLYVLPYLVLISQIVLVILFVTILSRGSWGGMVTKYLANHSIILGFLVTLVAVLGSLFYSEIMNYEPCSLCWWQRVLLFPQVILFLTALKFKDRHVFRYVWRLAFLAGIVALYQLYVQFGGHSILPCTTVSGSCSKVYVNAFGFLSIPLMSLTVALYVLLLAWVDKLHENRHS